MFDRMEVAEKFHKGGTPSKTPTRSEANRDGHVRKRNGGEAASSTNPEKGRADKRKTKIQAIRVMRRPDQKIHACFVAPDTPHMSVMY